MGKGNRNKLQRAQSVSEVDQLLAGSEKNSSKKEAREKQKKKAARNGRIIAAICAVLAIMIVLILVSSVLQSTGAYARMTNIMKMEDGHYKVDKAMHKGTTGASGSAWEGELMKKGFEERDGFIKEMKEDRRKRCDRQRDESKCKSCPLRLFLLPVFSSLLGFFIAHFILIPLIRG